MLTKRLSKRSVNFEHKKLTKVFKDQGRPEKGKLFIDDLFPPNENSILAKDSKGNFIDPIDGQKRAGVFDMSTIEWKRASEIFPVALLFEEEINVDDVKQGKIGNCYFLSAIAAMCEFPRLISQTFLTKEGNAEGYYEIVFWIDGQYQIVIVDDYFPVMKGTNVLYFAKPNSFELWSILLEKAWAKVNGGYLNVISGWPSDVFRAFTGYGCEQLVHSNLSCERLWRIFSSVDKADGLICSSTKSDDSIISKGLVKNHAYSLIATQEITVNNKSIRLCLLRNPWGYKEWNGEWSDNSSLWTAEAKEQIQDKIQNKDDGSFWMKIEDVHRYFIRSDLCQIVYGGNTKIWNFDERDLKLPHIFNLYVENPGTVSVSLISKNWRYNRELRDVHHPTSLVIAKYDSNLKSISEPRTDFECFQDTEKARKLNPGNYVIWWYKAYDICESPKPSFLKMKVICDVNFKLKHIGVDKDFGLIKEIIAQSLRSQDNVPNKEVFYQVKNNFFNSGLAYRIALNPLNTVYQKWENDGSEIKNIALLPPFDGKEKEKFSFDVSPNGYGIILGIHKNNLQHSFNIKSEITQSACREGEEPVKVSRINYDDYCQSNINTIDTVYNYTTSTIDVLSYKERYACIDHNKLWLDCLEKKHPELVKVLKELKPVENEANLNWVVLHKKNGFYLGQANYTTREGRGCFHFNDDDSTWIGYWKKNEKGNYGKLYDKRNKLVYEGEYEKGKKQGKGTFYFPNGDKYVGDFWDGKRSGTGVFYWRDGTRWEGHFEDNECDGEGLFYEGEDSWPVQYNKGKVVA